MFSKGDLVRGAETRAPLRPHLVPREHGKGMPSLHASRPAWSRAQEKYGEDNQASLEPPFAEVGDPLAALPTLSL